MMASTTINPPNILVIVDIADPFSAVEATVGDAANPLTNNELIISTLF
ncbi:protein of unknown function [Shewanella benthica]|uniref:Uncharacterized protein n=1 Tax=Shewanella benthica TaxID=43661 RepID=A0A330MCJ7_9GAMM|nr:protein of unknown function [Shewanella benthica]